MKRIPTLLILLFAFTAQAQSSSTPELQELEALLSTCEKATNGYELTRCLVDRSIDISNALKNLLDDDCRWGIWSKGSDVLCGEKAQYEGQGTFFSRRLAYCNITQSLLLYGQLLDQKLGGHHSPDSRLLDLNNDPDNPQLFPLQRLREKILDKNSKEIKCEQRPMV